MGQKSSQVNPFKDPVPGKELGVRPAKSQLMSHRGERARKTNENPVGSEDQDEENARALLQLREAVENNACPTSSNDDDLAASAQLLAESSPARGFTPFAMNNGNGKDLKRANGFSRDENRRHKKQKRQDHEAFPEVDDSYDESGHDIDVPPSKRSKHNDAAGTPDGRLSLGQSTFSLDDIPTDDETIATFFQEYENNIAKSTPPFSTQVEAVESESQMQQLAATVSREEPDLPLQSAYQLPTSSSPPFGKHKKAKRKRTSRSNTILETSDINGLEQTNGIGQHDFGIDFAAFDEYINYQQGVLADISTQHTDCDLLIDPDLIQDDQILKPAKEDAGPDLDSVCRPQIKTTEFERVSSSAQRENSVVDASIINRDNIPDAQLEDIGVDHQDEILPGIEDLSTGSSPEVTWSESSSSQAVSATSSVKDLRRQNTPPALTKPSKPRGNKTQQGGKKGKNYNPPLEQIAQKGGVFTGREISKLDAFRNAYCLENKVTGYQFNELVQSGTRGNSQARCFWNNVHETLPYRTRMSTQRFCKRRYHNYSARGTWTQSEDESLKQAVMEKGKSWKVVGEMIERFPEDCRDRYRNYHINAENRNRSQWTMAEVRNLCRAVYSCMQVMKEERERDRKDNFDGKETTESAPESDQEIQEMKLINWQAVSDRMGPAGGGRSRLQCSSKWAHLKMVDVRRYWKELKEAMRSQSKKRSESADNTTWRMNKALKKLRNMKVGDRYDFLQAFATCGADEESNIPWKVLGNEEFRSRWSVAERKAALEKFKREVPEADNFDYRHLVNRLLTQLLAASMGKLDERWDPARHGDVSLPKRSKLTAEQRKRRREELERQYGVKSSQLVHSEDEDQPNSSAQVVEETEEDTANRSNLALSDDAEEKPLDENDGASPDVPADSETEDSTDELFIGSDREEMADKASFRP